MIWGGFCAVRLNSAQPFSRLLLDAAEGMLVGPHFRASSHAVERGRVFQLETFQKSLRPTASKLRPVQAARTCSRQARPCDTRDRLAKESTMTAIASTAPVIIYRSEDERSSIVRPLAIDWMTMMPSSAE